MCKNSVQLVITELGTLQWPNSSRAFSFSTLSWNKGEVDIGILKWTVFCPVLLFGYIITAWSITKMYGHAINEYYLTFIRQHGHPGDQPIFKSRYLLSTLEITRFFFPSLYSPRVFRDFSIREIVFRRKLLSSIVEGILSFPTVFVSPKSHHPSHGRKSTIEKVVTQVVSSAGISWKICQPQKG